MSEVVLALGSNLLNRERNLKTAIESIERLPGTSILDVSRIYLTKPFLVPDKQNDYLNCCVKLETTLRPKTLLGSCFGIEATMGRKRPYKNAARIIDIDLLLYEDFTCCDDDLILPHPRIMDRAFVMVPLSDLYPNKSALGFVFSKAMNQVDLTEVILFKK